MTSEEIGDLTTRHVTALVLAAGSSRRMGRPKQLLPWGDTTVLGATLRQVLASTVDEVLLITGHEAAAVAAAAAGVPTVHNPDYDSGEMLSSLKAGVRARPDTDAVLVVLGDQPLVATAVYDLIVKAFKSDGHDLAAPVYEGRRGNPVLIGAAYFAELLALPAGAAPRDLLRRYQDRLHLVPVADKGILIDLDTPEVYERFRPQAGSSS